MFYNLLPLFLGVAQDYRELDNQGIGILSSMFFAGYTLTTSTAYFWIRRVNWRTVKYYSLAVGSLALLLAGYSQNHSVLILCIFIAGGAFSTVYGISATALGDTSNPARWYGVKISAEAMLGVILLFLLPGTLISSYGYDDRHGSGGRRHVDHFTGLFCYICGWRYNGSSVVTGRSFGITQRFVCGDLNSWPVWPSWSRTLALRQHR